jgi:hypothetical protein
MNWLIGLFFLFISGTLLAWVVDSFIDDYRKRSNDGV